MTNEIQVIRFTDMFAMVAHASVKQVRKYTLEPYINHPRKVMSIVSALPYCTLAMKQGALLHDVVEDTGITIDMIGSSFGDEVKAIVAGLTDVSQPHDGNRAARKAKDAAHLASQPDDTKTIKLADSIDNVKNILFYDKNFARVYLKEKFLLLDAAEGGDKSLHTRLHKMIVDGAMELHISLIK